MENSKAGELRVSFLNERKGEVCRAILESLPEWFGITRAIDDYVVGVESIPMLVATEDSGTVVGFVSLKPQMPSSLEAYVLGVRRNWHGKGCGHLLFQAAERFARSLGASFLTVKTLAVTKPRSSLQGNTHVL